MPKIFNFLIPAQTNNTTLSLRLVLETLMEISMLKALVQFIPGSTMEDLSEMKSKVRLTKLQMIHSDIQDLQTKSLNQM